MHRSELTVSLKSRAAGLGFALTGVCPAVIPGGIHRFREWLDRGYAGEMRYLPNRADAYEHPNHVLNGVRSLLLLAMPYRTAEPVAIEAGQGRVSRYAWGELDYHDLIHDRLKQLIAYLHEQAPEASARGVVDTAPLLEREFAQMAGLGWVGKNTLLLNKEAGSWFFLAAVLTDLELDYDEPFAADHCGTCRACLDACPTDAFPQPYVLDATKCISYLTIELRGSIPESLRSGIGDWLFGCDVCQDVCPWNRRTPESTIAEFQPRKDLKPVELVTLFDLDEAAFRTRFRHTPMWRAKRRGLLRNAAIILGNQRCETAIPALLRGLNDDEPLIRAACAWALAQMNSAAASNGLRERLAIESDTLVIEEIQRSTARPKPEGCG